MPLDVAAVDYEFEGKKLNALNASASMDKSGKIHISIVNVDLNNAVSVDVDLRGFQPHGISGKIITSDNVTNHNTFEKPTVIKPEEFKGANLKKGVLTAAIPGQIGCSAGSGVIY